MSSHPAFIQHTKSPPNSPLPNHLQLNTLQPIFTQLPSSPSNSLLLETCPSIISLPDLYNDSTDKDSLNYSQERNSYNFSNVNSNSYESLTMEDSSIRSSDLEFDFNHSEEENRDQQIRENYRRLTENERQRLNNNRKSSVTAIPNNLPARQNSKPIQTNMNVLLKNLIKRSCWICLDDQDFSELDNKDLPANYNIWIYPCKCKGSCKWVHQSCLRRWIDMEQKGDLSKKIKCPQCGYTYCLEKPSNYKSVKVGNRILDVSKNISLFGMASILFSGVTVILSGVGSVVAIRVFGSNKVIDYTRSKPVVSFFTFCMIAPMLIATKKYAKWEGPVLKIVTRFTEKDKESYESTKVRIDATLAPNMNNCTSRLIIGSLMTPFIGCWIGEKLLKNREYFNSEDVCKRLLRCFFGSSIYISIKSVLKTYYLFNLNEMHKHTRISNYKKETKKETSRMVGRFRFPLFS